MERERVIAMATGHLGLEQLVFKPATGERCWCQVVARLSETLSGVRKFDGRLEERGEKIFFSLVSAADDKLTRGGGFDSASGRLPHVLSCAVLFLSCLLLSSAFVCLLFSKITQKLLDKV